MVAGRLEHGLVHNRLGLDRDGARACRRARPARAFPGRGLVRAIVLIPWAIPTVISARMWNWMLHDQFGVVNDLLVRLGLISAPIAWTANADTALWAVVMVDVWKTTPFMALLILASLQMLPGDIYEAARVDGIHPVRVFFRVTLPLIRPAPARRDHLPRSRCPEGLRPDLRADRERGRHALDVRLSRASSSSTSRRSGLGSAASTLVFLIIAFLTVVYLVAGRVRLGAEAAR